MVFSNLKDELGITRLRVTGAGGGGSQPVLRYDFTVDHTTFPAGNEIVGTGIMLEVDDSIIDIGVSVPAALANGGDFLFGADDLSASKRLSGNLLNANFQNDGTTYSGNRGAGVYYDVQMASIGDAQGRLPCRVLTAHELNISCPDAIDPGDSCDISVYVLPAACAIQLPTPSSA